MSRTPAVELSDEDQALLTRVADRLCAMRLAVPAMMTLETVSPMNMVSASMLTVFSPVWKIVVPASRIDDLARLLEQRDAIPTFIAIIDAAEDRWRHDQRARRAEARAARGPRRFWRSRT